MPGALPQPLTSFVGRQWELQELGELLPRHRLLTLMGAGGCGKTRLAIELAKRQEQFTQDRVWFVDLASIENADFLETAIAAVIGSRLGTSDDFRASLSERLGEAP